MSIIIKPIVTEKVTKESEVLNRFDSLLTEKPIKFRLRKLLKLLMSYYLSVNTMNVRPDRTTNTLKVVSVERQMQLRSNCSSTRRRNN
jgi:large subunit ribosomal protein L23